MSNAPKGRFMGLDVGMKTIGVALSDELGWVARPETTIQRFSWKADLQALSELISQFSVHTAVIGLPLGPNGEMTDQARFSQGAGNKIKETFPELKVTYVDESHSSQDAEAWMAENQIKHKKRKKMIDQVAAMLFLQDFLNEQSRKTRS